MNNMINNIIKYSLGIMAIVAVGIFSLSPAITEARERTGSYKGYSEEYTDTTYNYAAPNYNPYNPNAGVFINGVAVSTARAQPKTVAPAPAETPTTDYKEVKEEFSDITANALYGANGFFPSSLMGWLLFAIIVLIIIILARKFMGLEKKYHSVTLKHS